MLALPSFLKFKLLLKVPASETGGSVSAPDTPDHHCSSYLLSLGTKAEVTFELVSINEMIALEEPVVADKAVFTSTGEFITEHFFFERVTLRNLYQ